MGQASSHQLSLGRVCTADVPCVLLLALSGVVCLCLGCVCFALQKQPTKQVLVRVDGRALVGAALAFAPRRPSCLQQAWLRQ